MRRHAIRPQRRQLPRSLLHRCNGLLLVVRPDPRLELPLSPVGRAYLTVLRLGLALRANRAWQRLRPLKWLFIHSAGQDGTG